MSIALKNYVNITSGLGAGAVVPTRKLVGRLFTDNVLLPPRSFVSFTTASQVGAYFGTTSEEYYRAVFYFGWISKNLTTPDSIQYARWVDVAQNPMIFSADNGFTLSSWTTISNGAFFITIDGVQQSITGLNFTGSLIAVTVPSNVATIVQNQCNVAYNSVLVTGTLTATSDVVTVTTTAGLSAGMLITGANIPYGTTILTIIDSTSLQMSAAATGSGVEVITYSLNTISVTYSASHGFVFDYGVATPYANGAISVQPGLSPNTDVSGAGLLGWYPEQDISSDGSIITAGAIWSGGSSVEDLDFMLTNSIQQSNNFGSFLFLNNLVLDLAEITQVANFNDGENVLFLYTVPVIAADVSDYYDALNLIGGVALTLDPVIARQYPEMVPMMIAAATNYSAQNSVQNYMYQIFPLLTASVTDTSTADGYNALNINYYGNTQTAGVVYSFYQQGYLQGALVPTDITDMGPYVNEIWLKDAASAAILSLLLSLAQIPANAQGQNLILGVLQGVINMALNNGTISVGKALTTLQQIYITNETGLPEAWYQVQNNGYWLDCVIQPEISNPAVYEAVYTLIYSKNDVVRLVTGTHVLI